MTEAPEQMASLRRDLGLRSGVSHLLGSTLRGHTWSQVLGRQQEQPLSGDALLIRPGKRGVDTPLPLRALAGSQAGVPVVKALWQRHPRSGFSSPSCVGTLCNNIIKIQLSVDECRIPMPRRRH